MKLIARTIDSTTLTELGQKRHFKRSDYSQISEYYFPHPPPLIRLYGEARLNVEAGEYSIDVSYR